MPCKTKMTVQLSLAPSSFFIGFYFMKTTLREGGYSVYNPMNSQSHVYVLMYIKTLDRLSHCFYPFPFFSFLIVLYYGLQLLWPLHFFSYFTSCIFIFESTLSFLTYIHTYIGKIHKYIQLLKTSSVILTSIESGQEKSRVPKITHSGPATLSLG